ncbi:hypothetical protein KSC_024660 [Ktedonobacter sp. SOSP1-52]|nr:hypothetical protein KSC_024660 [Ktedonobacter sp. SOSP1-52]
MERFVRKATFGQKGEDDWQEKNCFNGQEQPGGANQQFGGKKRVKDSYSKHPQHCFPERGSIETNLI